MAIVEIPRKKVISIDSRTIKVDLPETLESLQKRINYDLIERAKGALRRKVKSLHKYLQQSRSGWE